MGVICPICQESSATNVSLVYFSIKHTRVPTFILETVEHGNSVGARVVK